MTELEQTCSMLKRTAMEHGPKSPIGRRCFNILELTYEMPRPPEEWIDYLMPDSVPEHYRRCVHEIARQAKDLHRLLAEKRGRFPFVRKTAGPTAGLHVPQHDLGPASFRLRFPHVV